MFNEDPVFSREQEKELKRIWEERYHEPSKKRSIEEAITWVTFLSSARHWYIRLAEEKEPDPWTALTTALMSVNPDLTQGEWIFKLEQYFHIPYIRPKPEKPPKEEKPKVEAVTRKELEETQKRLKEITDALKEITKRLERVTAPPKPKLTPTQQESILLHLADTIKVTADDLHDAKLITDEEYNAYISEISTERLGKIVEAIHRGEDVFEGTREEFEAKITLLDRLSKRKPVEAAKPKPVAPFPPSVIVEAGTYVLGDKEELARSMAEVFTVLSTETVDGETVYTFRTIRFDNDTTNFLSYYMGIPRHYFLSGQAILNFGAMFTADVYIKATETDFPTAVKDWFMWMANKVIPEVRERFLREGYEGVVGHVYVFGK